MSADLESEQVVQALFLHDRLLAHLDPRGEQALNDELRVALAHTFSPDLARAFVLERLVAAAYVQGLPEELSVAHVTGELSEGQLVTTTQRFYFRKDGPGRRLFHAPLDVDADVKVLGRYSEDRCIGTTGRDELSGSRRTTILAHVVSVSPTEIELQPLFIGWRFFHPKLELGVTTPNGAWEMHPVFVDQFRIAQDLPLPTAAQLKRLSQMPEKEVKQAFAEIIGEAFVQKDWGGENSDLLTSRLLLQGEPVTTAFAFKGPGVRGTLHISNMGKNGDQGLRLFNEPADLIVVQHHAAIDAAVRRLLDALARKHERRWMVIDGQATAMILLAHGRLGE